MNMSWLVAKSAIDFFIRSLHSTGKAIFPLEFHGGGEPFSAFSLMQKAVAYTQQQCRSCGIEPHITAGTNGMLDRRKLDYAVQNFSAMVISFEGLPFVQNRQRPLASGRDSFSALDRALRFLDANKFPYVIRTTVTALNQDRLIETLEFIAGRYACRTWIVEPMQACGSGTPKKVDALTPDLLKFAEKFCHLSELARSYGLLLEYSGAQFDRRSTTFCHVGRNEVAVTPDGCLTNCWEVSSAAHPRAGQFIFGKILPDGKVWVDEIKWQSLRSCRVQNLPLCRDCFAKYHCAGGCPLRMGHLEGRPAADSSFCRSTREIMLQKVRKLLDRAHIDRGYRENWKSFMAKFQEAK